MKLKPFGFWKEDNYPNMPSVQKHINKTQINRGRIDSRIYYYLILSPCIDYWTGATLTHSCIDGNFTKKGGFIRTDGCWVWKTDIIHDYLYNGLTFPPEFIRHIKLRVLPFPLFHSIIRFLKRDNNKVWFFLKKNDIRFESSTNVEKFNFKTSEVKYNTFAIFKSMMNPKEDVIKNNQWIFFDDLKDVEFCVKFSFSGIITEVLQKDNFFHVKVNLLSIQESALKKRTGDQFEFRAQLTEKISTHGSATLEKVFSKSL